MCSLAAPSAATLKAAAERTANEHMGPSHARATRAGRAWHVRGWRCVWKGATARAKRGCRGGERAARARGSARGAAADAARARGPVAGRERAPLSSISASSPVEQRQEEGDHLGLRCGVGAKAHTPRTAAPSRALWLHRPPPRRRILRARTTAGGPSWGRTGDGIPLHRHHGRRGALTGRVGLEGPGDVIAPRLGAGAGSASSAVVAELTTEMRDRVYLGLLRMSAAAQELPARA